MMAKVLVVENDDGFREDMVRASQPPHDLIYQASLLWRAIYHVVDQYRQQHPEFQIVRHEDLSLDPLYAYKQLYQGLGVPFTARVAKRIHSSTNPGNPTELPLDPIHAINLDSRANLKNWQKRMTAEEIDRVRELTSEVADLYYNEEDWV